MQQLTVKNRIIHHCAIPTGQRVESSWWDGARLRKACVVVVAAGGEDHGGGGLQVKRLEKVAVVAVRDCHGMIVVEVVGKRGGQGVYQGVVVVGVRNGISTRRSMMVMSNHRRGGKVDAILIKVFRGKEVLLHDNNIRIITTTTTTKRIVLRIKDEVEVRKVAIGIVATTVANNNNNSTTTTITVVEVPTAIVIIIIIIAKLTSQWPHPPPPPPPPPPPTLLSNHPTPKAGDPSDTILTPVDTVSTIPPYDS